MAIDINEWWCPTGNYTPRSNAPIKMAAHTTEGIQDLYDLGPYFQGDVGASSHWGADNKHKDIFGAYVDEADGAWTQCQMNWACLSVEQCTPSGAAYGWSRDTWLSNQGLLLHNTARLFAYVAEKYQLPLVALNNSQSQDSWTKGFTQHANFGQPGCGHGDCGEGYPMDKVLEWAREILAGGGTPSGTEGDMAVACYTWQDQNYYAGLGTNGEVKFRQPGGEFFAVDTSQSGAKSGCGLTITTAGKVTISYTNGKGAACIYERASGGGTWGWASISPDNSFR